MMQEIGVAIVVVAALAFLARQFFGIGRKPRKAVTFVPLGSLKNKKPDDHCH
jgi:hypothetical protein